MGEWQPIETAPAHHSGKQIDLWAAGERYADCWWGWPTYGGKKGVYGWVHRSGYDCDGPVDDWVPNPTHWMPLPEPPGTPSPREAAIQQLVEALEVAQKTLAILINPEANEKATGAGIINAFARCTEAEAKARAALSAYRKETQ